MPVENRVLLGSADLGEVLRDVLFDVLIDVLSLRLQASKFVRRMQHLG